MNKLFPVADLHKSVQAYLKRQFRGALIVFLFLGLSYGTLFIGVSKSDGLWAKLDTGTPDTPVPSATPDTPVPTNTPTGTLLPTNTHPAQPGGPTDTPRPTKIIRPRSTPVITGTAGAAATQTKIGGAAGSITPESSLTMSPSPTPTLVSIGPITIIPLPPQVSNVVNRTYLLLLALLGIGGGSVSVNRLWGIKENNGSSHAGGGSAVPKTAINPTTVGALGFAAWLAGQVPVPTPEEKEVLAKVENGIGSAANQVGGSSDLNQIAEIGTEEFLQLTKSSPFLS